jgi:hypothetical protein
MDYRSSPPMVAPIAFRPHPTSYTHHYESNKAPVMPRFQLGYPDIDYSRFNQHHHQPTWAENAPYQHTYYTSRSTPYPLQTTSSSTRPSYPIIIN